MPAAHTFELRYSPTLIRRAVRGFVRWRLVDAQPGLWIAQALLLALAALFGVIGSRTEALVFGGLALVPGLLVLAGWAAHLAYKLRTLRAMGAPIATVAIDPDGLRFRSGAGAFALPFTAVRDWRERPGFWLLLFAPNQFVVLPTATLPVAVLDRLRERLAENLPAR